MPKYLVMLESCRELVKKVEADTPGDAINNVHLIGHTTETVSDREYAITCSATLIDEVG